MNWFFWGIDYDRPIFIRLLVDAPELRKNNTLYETSYQKEEIDILKEQFDATLQYFYFLQLLGTFIYPDFNKLDNMKNNLTIYDIDLKQAINKKLI